MSYYQNYNYETKDKVIPIRCSARLKKIIEDKVTKWNEGKFYSSKKSVSQFMIDATLEKLERDKKKED